MKKCRDKEEGALYPTTKILHEAIMKIPELKMKWGQYTTYRILMLMGFRYFKNIQIITYISISAISISSVFQEIQLLFFQLFVYFKSSHVPVDAECNLFFGPLIFYFGI